MIKQRIKKFFARFGIFVLVTVIMAIMFLYSVMWVCVFTPERLERGELQELGQKENIQN